jgi:hypothetical protein
MHILNLLWNPSLLLLLHLTPDPTVDILNTKLDKLSDLVEATIENTSTLPKYLHLDTLISLITGPKCA